jgi:hypothetical protein
MDSMTESKKRRLPRAKRVAEEDRPNMILTDRDCDILKLVNDCRILRNSHIEALFFQSRSTAQFRLSRLFHHEFLERHFLSVVTGGPASSPALYSLGKRGAYTLVSRFGYERDQIHRVKKEAIGWHVLEHVLMINDVRVAVMQACRQEGIDLLDWREENIFRAEPDYVEIKDKRERTHKKPVLPDGYFCLNTPKGKSRFFLELDRGTEVLSKVLPQLQVYEAYTVSGQYQTRFQAKSLRILIVTTTPKRLQSLKATARKVEGDRKYWFTTFDQIKSQTVLTAPIWQQLDSHTLHRLIDTDG